MFEVPLDAVLGLHLLCLHHLTNYAPRRHWPQTYEYDYIIFFNILFRICSCRVELDRWERRS